MAIFGTDADDDSCTMLYFDERGVARRYSVAFHADGLTWSRDPPQFGQRFRITIANDGQTMEGVGTMRKHTRRGNRTSVSPMCVSCHDVEGKPRPTRICIASPVRGCGPERDLTMPCHLAALRCCQSPMTAGALWLPRRDDKGDQHGQARRTLWIDHRRGVSHLRRRLPLRRRCFRAELDLSAGAGRRNCSICQKSSVTSAIAKPSKFELLSGNDLLGMYEWGGKISRRCFCKDCGIHVFARGHLAELGGDYVSVNVNALDDVELTEVAVVHWDGRHDIWQAGPRPSPWPVHTTSPSAGG